MKINNDIAIFERRVPGVLCDRVIEHYKHMSELNRSFPRHDSVVAKRDTTVFPFHPDSLEQLTPDQPTFPEVLEHLWSAWQELRDAHYDYVENTLWIRSMRLQKTTPGQGYHTWHYEADGRYKMDRVLAWSIYLNTVLEGGETEFLRQHTRVCATQGTIVFWPAAYTHPHRGNPPLSGNKYLLTGWLEC